MTVSHVTAAAPTTAYYTSSRRCYSVVELQPYSVVV